MKHKLFLILLLLLIFSCSVMITFSFFSVKLAGEGEENIISVGSLKLIYTDSNEISLIGAYPGQSITKSFTVSNEGTFDVFYDLSYKDLKNEIENDELVVSYTCTSYIEYENSSNKGNIIGNCGNISDQIVPYSEIFDDFFMSENIEITSGTTHEYTITFSFKEINDNQNYNQGKHFSTLINVLESKNWYEKCPDNSLKLSCKILDADIPSSDENIDFSFASNGVKLSDDMQLEIIDPTKISNGFYYTSDLSITEDVNNDGVGERIFYYRGDVDNNYVIFAGFCWKIVRTTGLGGVKLIYNGVVQDNNSCDNIGAATFIERSRFHNASEKIEYVGYSFPNETTQQSYLSITKMPEGIVFAKNVSYDNGIYTLHDTIVPVYDSSSSIGFKEFADTLSTYHYSCLTTDTTCSSVKYFYMARESALSLYYVHLTADVSIEAYIERVFENGMDYDQNTLIHNKIDSWFADNLINYDSYLEDSIWCNDKSIGEIGGWKSNNAIYEASTQELSMKLQFGSLYRIINGSPSFYCKNFSDRFTKNSMYGNGKLTYPIGLLTADELMFAGDVWWVGDTQNYLYNNGTNKDIYWWTMSPAHVSANNVYIFVSYGCLDGLAVNFSSLSLGIRPSITLNKNVEISDGSGTLNSPYIIN